MSAQCMNFIYWGFLGPASDKQYTLRIWALRSNDDRSLSWECDRRYRHSSELRSFVGKNRQGLVTVVEGFEVKELLFSPVVDKRHVDICDRPTPFKRRVRAK